LLANSGRKAAPSADAANRIESHVVDAASIAVPRRRRRAKTDAIDGETLLRTLLAWKRGEPRVCAIVAPPSPEQEDQRRISRERAILLRERVRHVNRIKGLLASQGITDFEPLHKDRRIRLDALRTGDGRPLPPRLEAELLREIDLIELLYRSPKSRRNVTAPPNSTRKIGRPLCCSHASEGLVRRLPQCFISKAFTGTLAIDAR